MRGERVIGTEERKKGMGKRKTIKKQITKEQKRGQWRE